MQSDLTLDWADGSYNFKLPWASCAEIERKSGAGIQSVYERLMTGQSYLVDVSEIIRQALLGGSGGTVDGQQVECKPHVVNALIERYVTGPDRRPFSENWDLAKVTLHTFMVGYAPAQKPAQKKRAPRKATAST